MICRSKTYEEDPPLWSSPSICFIWPKSGVSGCIGQSKLLLCDQYALREAWEALLCQLVSHLLFYCNIYRCQSSPKPQNGSSKLLFTVHAIQALLWKSYVLSLWLVQQHCDAGMLSHWRQFSNLRSMKASSPWQCPESCALLSGGPPAPGHLQHSNTLIRWSTWTPQTPLLICASSKHGNCCSVA